MHGCTNIGIDGLDGALCEIDAILDQLAGPPTGSFRGVNLRRRLTKLARRARVKVELASRAGNLKAITLLTGADKKLQKLVRLAENGASRQRMTDDLMHGLTGRARRPGIIQGAKTTCADQPVSAAREDYNGEQWRRVAQRFTGDSARILDGQFADITSDGLVFLGDRNRSFSNDIDVSSVSSVFINGNRNIVRGGTISRTRIGVWFLDGDRNIAKGVDYNDVPQPELVGDTRDLDADSVSPLSLE